MPAAPTGSKELDQLVARFKRGYALEKTRGGHFRVRNPKGEFVELNGKNLTLTGTAHGGRAVANMTAELRNAGVLKATTNGKVTTRRKMDRAVVERRQKAQRESLRIRSENRQKVADELYERLDQALKSVGGINGNGVRADLANVGALVARQSGHSNITPDLTTGSVYRLTQRHWVEPRYQEVWSEVAERVEQADDKTDAWFALVREARGLPGEVVHVGKPIEGDWPFEVRQLAIEALLIDHEYQRPPDWPFIRRTAAAFDESLVGTIDVSERRHGAIFAILDGQQRYEACRLVGKKTVWASVYSGLDRASEARFFLHKNRDKKAIHPFYTFRARLAAQEPDALAIEKRTAKHGYKVTAQAANERYPEQISAIAALDEAFGRKQPDGKDALDPSLQAMKASTFGMRHGQNHILIRALGIVFQEKGDLVEMKRIQDVLIKTPPELMLQKAREAARYASSNTGWAMARIIASDYDRGLSREQKLGKL